MNIKQEPMQIQVEKSLFNKQESFIRVEMCLGLLIGTITIAGIMALLI